ncbi:hypothetical protein M5361_14905 [Ligilactobacillus agilis]|nr:hypothetical protein [Ligilactobacillus agilis]MCL8206418.1 hypothetical protein [Ligilactobacillus agilis]
MDVLENLKNLESEIGKVRSDLAEHEHDKSQNAHFQGYELVPDGTDIATLPSGKYFGNNFVNAPRQLRSKNRVAVEVDAIDGNYKKITVRNVAMPYEYVTYGDWDWQKGENLVWGSSIIGRKLKMAEGVVGDVFENIFWHGDHTEINIQGRVTLNSPGESGTQIRLASNSIVARYQKNRPLHYSVPALLSDNTYTTVTMILTQYGNLNIISPGKYFTINSFSIGTIIEPDGTNYSQNGVPPFYVGKNHTEGDDVYDGSL